MTRTIMLCVAAFPAFAVSNKTAAEKPNIIVILGNDVGYGCVSFNGATKVRTPSIDRIAQEGIRFTDANTPNSACAPRQREELSGTGGLNQCLPNVGRADRLEAPDYVDGMSLVPWLKGPSKPMEQPAMTTWGRGNYSLRTKEWRYTRYFDGTEEAPQVKSGRELYNVADPDSPTRNIVSYKNNVKQYKKAGLQPPLD